MYAACASTSPSFISKSLSIIKSTTDLPDLTNLFYLQELKNWRIIFE